VTAFDGGREREDVLLVTERLVLRRFRPADAGFIFELDSDPEVMHFITGGLPTSMHEIEETILPRWVSYYDEGPFVGFWAAEDRMTAEVLGWFHLRPSDSGPSDEFELGYRLKRSAWGRGLATEGARALVDMAFVDANASRVFAEGMVVHAASRRVMEKAGLSLVRVFRADWPYAIPGDDQGDVEYAVTREDWERRR
jgi:RimJ/RimL family protein N-acetyltransferase